MSVVHTSAAEVKQADENEKIGVCLLLSTKLPKFKAFSSFFVLIVVSGTVTTRTPEYRKLRNNEGPHLPFREPVVINQLNESEDEDAESTVGEVVSAEDTFEVREKVRIGIKALTEYINTHSNPIRNRLIIRLVLFEGKTYEEAALAAGCSSPVVGYLVREAQRYAREKMGS